MCGEPGPIELLAFAANERVERVHALAYDDEAWLYEIVAYDTGAPSPVAMGTRLVLGDACGGRSQELWGGPLADAGEDELVVCDESTATLLFVDPERGTTTPIVTNVACAAKPTPHGVVALREQDDGLVTLLVVRETEGELVLARDLRPPFGMIPGTSAFAIGDDFAIVHAAAGQMLRIDFASGESTTMREGVADFRVDRGLEHVVWQAGIPDDPDATAIGPVATFAIADDVDRTWIDARLSWTPLPWLDPYLVVRARSWGDDRVFDLESGASIALPEASIVQGVGEGEQLVYAVGGVDWLDLDLRVWTRDGGHRPLFRGVGLVALRDAGIERFVPDEGAALASGTLTLLPWKGGAPQQLATALAWPYTRRDDGSILSVRDDDGDRLGVLELHTAAGVVVVADDAYVHDPSLSRRAPFSTDVAFHDVDADAARLVRAALSE